MARFYQLHFGLLPLPSAGDGGLELAPAESACAIALHQAARTQKSATTKSISSWGLA